MAPMAASMCLEIYRTFEVNTAQKMMFSIKDIFCKLSLREKLHLESLSIFIKSLTKNSGMEILVSL